MRDWACRDCVVEYAYKEKEQMGSIHLTIHFSHNNNRNWLPSYHNNKYQHPTNILQQHPDINPEPVVNKREANIFNIVHMVHKQTNIFFNIGIGILWTLLKQLQNPITINNLNNINNNPNKINLKICDDKNSIFPKV